ncbi:hypothetical protein [Thermoflavifilum thermophilum]|uniref:Uncharacterized protein n=1 Tax=Thermoflavifilum thermophilum TaxID=1393122 RepID=A0A1I7NCT0_9BACT|nr:hypothetical protein [Thermoflavifilum thermophilum]SFV32495.1 hypothetical protein SAMN05660895_1363 [Thermoflavifilum thermophilum]
MKSVWRSLFMIWICTGMLMAAHHAHGQVRVAIGVQMGAPLPPPVPVVVVRPARVMVVPPPPPVVVVRPAPVVVVRRRVWIRP